MGFIPYDGIGSGSHARTFTAQLAASQTYLAGAAVGLVAAQLTEPAADGEGLVGAFVGIAANPATDYLAASRTAGATTLGRFQPATEASLGAVAETNRTFYYTGGGQTFTTTNLYTAEDDETEVATWDPDSATVGLWTEIQIAKPDTAGVEWGLLAAAATRATDVSFQIIDLINSQGLSVLSNTTSVTSAQRAGNQRDGTQPWRFVCRHSNPELCQLAGGSL